MSRRRIEELLRIFETRKWTDAEYDEARRLGMGREAGYIPEGTEDWMEEDGVPRSYDKPPKRPLSPDVSLPPLRPAEPAELAKHGKPVREEEWTAPSDHEARLKTMEAAMADLYRRLKALEERVVDPSV